MASVGDRNFALAYSSGAALQASVRADGDVDTSAMGQPVLVVLRHVLAGPYEGLVIDQASAPAARCFPRALLEKIVEKLDEELTIKTLLADERTPSTAAAVAEALTRVPFWVAVGRGEGDRLGVAEARARRRVARFLEVYSHPLEVAAMGRARPARAAHRRAARPSPCAATRADRRPRRSRAGRGSSSRATTSRPSSPDSPADRLLTAGAISSYLVINQVIDKWMS